MCSGVNGRKSSERNHSSKWKEDAAQPKQETNCIREECGEKNSNKIKYQMKKGDNWMNKEGDRHMNIPLRQGEDEFLHSQVRRKSSSVD